MRSLRFAAVLGIVTCLLNGCRPAEEAPPPRVVRIAASSTTDGALLQVAHALARLYATSPDIRVEVATTDAAAYSINAVHEGSAELTFSRADALYGAYAQGTLLNPKPHDRLKGIAVLHGTALHLIVRGDSRARKLADLRGGRIGRSRSPRGNTPVLRYNLLMNVLSAGGELNQADVTTVTMSHPEVAAALADGTIQGGVILASYPVAAIEDLAHTLGIRLLEVKPDAATRTRAVYPFYRPVVIPASTYTGQTEDVRTIGVDNLLVCRDDVEEEVIYRLTKSLLELLPQLAQSTPELARIDPEFASTTPIPLHPGAARMPIASECS